MFEQSLCGYLGIVDEIVHLLFLITFRHVSYSYAVCCVVSLLQGDNGIFGALDFSYKYVVWVYCMGESRTYLTVKVEEFNFYVNSRFWEWHEENVFKRLWCGFCLVA